MITFPPAVAAHLYVVRPASDGQVNAENDDKDKQANKEE